MLDDPAVTSRLIRFNDGRTARVTLSVPVALAAVLLLMRGVAFPHSSVHQHHLAVAAAHE